MGNIFGDIAVAVGADIGPLKKEMAKGTKVLKGFGGDTSAMAKKMAKAGVVVATAAAAMGATLLAAGKQAAAAAVQINNMATVANAGTVEFQKMSVAAKAVNIEQEKLSDILKDVNDRVGDFVTTGGGPMADFFEKVAPKIGVTADMFARLSGPEALQLYYNSLERANLNQQEMTFFMEAMAGDATALIPILKNNGLAIKEMGDEAERAGRIMSDDLIQNGVKLDKVLGDAADTISTSMNKALLENADNIIAIADAIGDDLIPLVGDLLLELGKIGGAVGRGGSALVKYFRIIAGTEPDGPGTQTDKFGNDLSTPEDDSFPSGTGTRLLDENGNPIFEDTPGTDKPGGFGGGGAGGSDKGPTEEDLDRLVDQFATEAEIIEENYKTSLERLEEYRAAKLGKDVDYNDLEARINKDHQDAQVALERKAMDAKLKIAQKIFGGLSSLMRSENEKLFKIGKAAAIANAIVSTYKGVSRALGEYPYPASLAVAAAVAAKGFATVSSISSQSIGGGGAGAGGGGGGGGGGVPDTSAGGAGEQSSYFNVSLPGEGAISRGAVRDLMGMINDEIEDGAQLRGITVDG